MVTTTDFPFATLAARGAAVSNPGHLLKEPPNFDQPHDRNARMPVTTGATHDRVDDREHRIHCRLTSEVFGFL